MTGTKDLSFVSFIINPVLKGSIMSDINFIVRQLMNGAHNVNKNGGHKLAGTIYIVVGFFLAPVLIGFPLMAYGVYLLFK